MRNLYYTCFYRVYLFLFRGMRKEIKIFCDNHSWDGSNMKKIQIEKDMKYWYLWKGISPTQYWEQCFDMIPK